jgi:hypothetical protein
VTGEKWWSTKGEIQPVRWELEVRGKKADKLLKALRRPEKGADLAPLPFVQRRYTEF